MNEAHQVFKNCGNFSAKVLPGMIAYGREREHGRGKLDATAESSLGDGYATREGDIQLGGFLFIQAAQAVSRDGKPLAEMTTQEKQKLVLRLSQEHIEKFGAANNESHDKWLKRVQVFARHRSVELPARGDRESSYDYARRLQKWTRDQAVNWPKIQPAVGTHLMFSPEPKFWEQLRSVGVDERQFLRNLLAKTMKDFADWRRQIHGPGRSLGWVAGTHVHADGAGRHPHIHLVVLKRDEIGKEVDWSVSALKGRNGRKEEPDPIRTIKQFFTRHAEKEYAKAIDRHKARENEQEPGAQFKPTQTGKKDPSPSPQPVRASSLGRHLHAVASGMRPLLPPGAWQIEKEIGAMLRIVGYLQQMGSRTLPAATPNLSLARLRTAIAAVHARARGPQLEPGF